MAELKSRSGASSDKTKLRALLRQGKEIKCERLKALDMITVRAAAELLLTDRATTLDLIHRGRCIGVLAGRGNFRIPRWQFGAAIWPQIQGIAERKGTKNGWVLLSFLETASCALNGMPHGWLSRAASRWSACSPRRRLIHTEGAGMKLYILSDPHAEFESFEVPKDLDYDVAILAGDIAQGRVVARWLRAPARFGDRPIVQIAANHEYYQTVMDRELAEMRREASRHGIHFLDRDEAVIGGVRFLGCTLWTDFRLHIDVPRTGGIPRRLLSDRRRSMGECRHTLADYSAIRVESPRTSNSLGTRPLAPLDTAQIHRRDRSWLRGRLADPFDGPRSSSPTMHRIASRWRRDSPRTGRLEGLSTRCLQNSSGHRCFGCMGTRMTASTIR